jgi:hypothetical protein
MNQFMTSNLSVVQDIINQLPRPFDSHDFIRKFARRFEVAYVAFLAKHEQEPFRNVHAQIARFLSANQALLQIKDNGVTSSANVFGDITQNEQWV